MKLPLFEGFFSIPVFFLNCGIVDVQYNMFQVYNIVIHSSETLYSIYSHYKMLAIFLLLYNISS